MMTKLYVNDEITLFDGNRPNSKKFYNRNVYLNKKGLKSQKNISRY